MLSRSIASLTLLVSTIAGAQNYNDPYYSSQFNLKLTRTDAAHSYTTGAGVVIAIVDTGIRSTTELPSSRVLPGYDFVSNTNDRDGTPGRDANPYDSSLCYQTPLPGGPGSDEIQGPVYFSHGTAVASVAAAAAGNSTGIVGAAPSARILPVRVKTRCSSTSSQDLAAAIRWSAGLDVPGVPRNLNPASVINISLGIGILCPPVVQSALDEVRSLDVFVVAAAGNQSSNDQIRSPASCRGTWTVGATDEFGNLAPYSNWGHTNTIAPGGYDPGSDTSARNVPVIASGTSVFRVAGTSFATPLVSGAAALLVARHGGGACYLSYALSAGSAGTGGGRLDTLASMHFENDLGGADGCDYSGFSW